MAKLKVLIETLEHDGKRRQPGELIDVDDPTQLLTTGAAELVKEPKEPKPPAK